MNATTNEMANRGMTIRRSPFAIRNLRSGA
jgi:hypothetical protein